MPAGADPGALRPTLDRAVTAGILTPQQAEAVLALGPPPDAGAPVAGRRIVLAEVLGYVGGALAVVAGLLLGGQLWAELAPVVRVALLAVVATACLAAGAALGTREGAPGRLGGFLWAAAVLAAGATVAVALTDVAALADDAALLVASGVALVLAALLWWRRREALQQVATFAAAVFALVTLLDTVDPGGDGALRYGGALVWVLGVAWILASARGLVTPTATGWALGGAAAVLGPLFAEAARSIWVVVAVLGAAALVVAGVRTSRPWIVALGTGGLFVAVPTAVAVLFDTDLGPLLALLVVGLLLVAAAVALTRRPTRSSPG